MSSSRSKATTITQYPRFKSYYALTAKIKEMNTLWNIFSVYMHISSAQLQNGLPKKLGFDSP
jgi:hypothetical protein